MNTLFLAANNGMSSVWTIAIFIGLIALMYFTMIKPQKKQQQKKMEMMNELKKGDHVVLIDGLHGKIDSVNAQDKTVVVDADGIYLTFSRMAVQQILPEAPATPAADSASESAPASTPS
ncbi:preprotein translocase subunit YajC, partial [Lactobacillus sp. XV13L]|nr:preprotein translocase subunit YajC [Lactobacillus sp. XV13L]